MHRLVEKQRDVGTTGTESDHLGASAHLRKVSIDFG